MMQLRLEHTPIASDGWIDVYNLQEPRACVEQLAKADV